MKTILGMDKAVQLIGQFSFSEFRVVRKLCFFSEGLIESANPKVELAIESENRSPNYRLEIVCLGVTNLRLKEFGGGETRVIGFDVSDVSNRQWQNVAWEILDFEHDTLSFLCRSIEIVNVTKV